MLRNATETAYTVRARTDGEALAHCITRGAFVRHVAADPRTDLLFRYWWQETGVDVVVDQMVALLDAAARRAALAHRSALRQPGSSYHLLPMLGVLQQLEAEYEQVLAQTHDERVRFAVGWVVAELYGTTVDEVVPIRNWLASDLVTIFRWKVAGYVYGEVVVPLTVGRSPTLQEVPPGQRPAHDGTHLRRNAEWYYRTEIQKPRTLVSTIAEEYRAASAAAGITLQPKYRNRVGNRADDSLVRAGVREAKRLLELTVPPEQWEQLSAKTFAPV